MFILDCSITIDTYTFTQVNNVQVVKSVDLLSDKAVIKLPASALFGNASQGFTRKKLETTIKTGMPVQVTLAYKDVASKVEFNGFVAFVKPNTPMVTLECEDAVYTIRKKRINHNFGATTLNAVLAHIVEGTGVQLAGDIPEVAFDKFVIKDKNGAQALEKIRDEYGLSIFIDNNGALYAGLRQNKGAGDLVTYDLHQNVIKHDLRYRNAEDVRLNVKVIGVQKDNKKIEVIVGDTDGEQRTLHKYNVSDKAILKQIGEAELDELKFDGYEGSITTFLIPDAERGMSAEIIDENYPNRAGRYFVPKVTTTFGVSGARRKIELGNKLAWIKS